MGTALPAPLRGALAGLVAASGTGLAGSADRLSRAYRAGGTSQALTRPEDAAAYAAARLPATYAAASVAFAELARLRPDFAPVSLNDFGCGPGSAALGAVDAFPSLESVRLVDRNPALLKAASTLFAESGLGMGRMVTPEQRDLEPVGDIGPAADLAVAGYMLVEMPEHRAAGVALALLAAARHALVLVEPGSTAGFRRLRLAREALIGAGATVLAPCTHQLACPVRDPDWCHFSVRLARSRDHLRAKSASAPFEDEKFSYLVVARSGPSPDGGRIVAPIRRTGAGFAVRECANEQISESTIGRSDPQYRAFRRLDWGDWLPATVPATPESQVDGP